MFAEAAEDDKNDLDGSCDVMAVTLSKSAGRQPIHTTIFRTARAVKRMTPAAVTSTSGWESRDISGGSERVR
jgi:hypothetical protein